MSDSSFERFYLDRLIASCASHLVHFHGIAGYNHICEVAEPLLEHLNMEHDFSLLLQNEISRLIKKP